MTFRSVWRADIKMRILDIVLHCLLAWLLPGHWWFQSLPDVAVPFLMLHGVLTNRLLAADNWLVVLHLEFFHSWALAVGCLIGTGLVGGVVWLTDSDSALLPVGFGMFCIHWLGHLLIDRFTHERWNAYRESV